ncbi:hypothetical protein N39L_38410 [Limnospira platensis NIES-39]|jgi:hypothetical protein|uniref:Uncharacterized protein n=1 Tax=Limnospira platensis NIES-46 TaxID=1236695 RepID=A0A5M3T4S7_LIMPL|nr:hypothetical protein N39L_38410 [Arthrospira platensis NIES-39]GCE92890.1 hypothetical protein NIES46_09340 [Arthrospira platensis NIES-46]
MSYLTEDEIEQILLAQLQDLGYTLDNPWCCHDYP